MPEKEKEATEPKPINQTIPGGRYEVGGKLVNAEGEPINETGEVIAKPEAETTETEPKAKSRK